MAGALVVGASSEIGAAVVGALRAAGHECLGWGRDAGRLAAAGCAGRVVDLRSPAEVDAALAELPDRLSVVVYAAGLFDWAPADTGDPDVWDELVTVNLAAAMRVTRGVLPALVAAAPSSLVLLGSAASHRAFAGNPAYVASKHGLAGFARSVFLDVRDRDVAVTLLSPGLVAAGAGSRAPGVRPDELLQPADVAEAVRWVVGTPAHVCPVEVHLQPQRTA
ncbi:SDR family NAD(P)-dependent oxidoreductase [Modestobacter sp. L9-4]|uniref:SDR family oxidoreductase n=1 Tax=Modestobacter sp. L9-4 TaxID=2851567 RepID=UPI001C78D0FE|nr:SDR family NAD(P)-dependent oxidoreductase [Modestobacter sp. L9-4]QXG75123.1 SDR family NAD(P)-dependent oxidoreductase [Modestobacter sp. L9-4]